MKQIKLSENAIKVLKAVVDCEEEVTGLVDEIIYYVSGIDKKQLSGYMSDLQKKDLILTDGYQASITDKGREVLK